jgi:hypothetical protein
MTPLHPIEPIPAGIANGRCGASSPIRRVVGHRLQSADTGPSRPRSGKERFDPMQTFAARSWKQAIRRHSLRQIRMSRIIS